MQKPEVLGRVTEACKSSITAVALFSGLANLLMLVPAFFMLNVYDKAVAYNSVSTLWMLCLVAGFLYIVLATMEILRSRVLVLVASRIDNIVAPVVFDRTFDQAVRLGEGRASIQPLVDLNSLRQFITGPGIFALFDAPWLPIYIAVLFLFHPLLGWMGVFAALIFLGLAIGNQVQTRAQLAVANVFAKENSVATQRALRNADAAAAMGMLPELRRRWRKLQDAMLDAQESASNYSSVYSATIKTLRLAVQSSALAAGAYLALAQEISPGMLIAGSILIGRALQPVEQAVGAWRGFVDAKAQYDTLVASLAEAKEPGSRQKLPPIEGKVLAKNAAILAPGATKPTISSLTFELPAGKLCVVMGPSGAGKSTLVKGVLGLWPCALGEIRIDGADASSYDKSDLGPQIGYLPQDVELLDGSVANNIARFQDSDPEAVTKAAVDAGLHELILTFPSGYDTDLGAPEGQLSPGLRQRIGLARALYQRPKLVVLDEPNANLDEVGEQALHTALDVMKKSGSTIIVVSHRPTILPLSDYVMVLNNGRVVQFGETNTVMEDFKKGQAKVQATAAGPKRALTVTPPLHN